MGSTGVFIKMFDAHDRYTKSVDEVEKYLFDKVEFEFSVFYQTDGFVILHEKGAHNALLSHCLEVINEKGFLSEKDYMELTF